MKTKYIVKQLQKVNYEQYANEIVSKQMHLTPERQQVNG